MRREGWRKWEGREGERVSVIGFSECVSVDRQADALKEMQSEFEMGFSNWLWTWASMWGYKRLEAELS